MLSNYKNASVAIYGLGKRGRALFDVLSKAGAEIKAWDDREEKRLEAIRADIDLCDFNKEGLEGFNSLMVAKYLSPTDKLVDEAKERGIPILTGLELFRKTHDQIKLFAVLGANGKSTTTTLIEKMFNDQGQKIYRATVEEGDFWHLGLQNSSDTVLVMDVRSDQLGFTDGLNPDISLLLNTFETPPHGYDDKETYLADLNTIFENPEGENLKIIAIDNDEDIRIYKSQYERFPETTYALSFGYEINKGIKISGSTMKWFDSQEDEGTEILNFNDVKHLKGRHNWQNIGAAFLLAKLNGLAEEKLVQTIIDFKGLPHRQYLARVINGVSYVDDSKSSHPRSTKVALKAFEKSYWIAGGANEYGENTGLEHDTDKIVHAFLIGDAKEYLAKWCEVSGVEYSVCDSLEAAVHEAHEMAQANRGAPGSSSTVLFSPAHDPDFPHKTPEESGEAFIELVKDLSEEVA